MPGRLGDRSVVSNLCFSALRSFHSSLLPTEQVMVRKSTKKSDVNKSQMIRDYKSQNPQSKPKEIAAYMKQHGHKVSPQYVSTILSTAKRKNGFALADFSDVNLSAEDLILVKQLVAKTGSVNAAKKAVELYSQLIV